MTSPFLRLLRERVLVFDGAMGTCLQALDLGPDDFEGLDGCNEVLVRSRPDDVRAIHSSYLEAGCDAVETNTLGANPVVLAEYGIAEQVVELNERAARLAREACEEHSTRDRPRFAAGSIGPGTRLPTLGQARYADLRDGYHEQTVGLLRGGVDALIVETCQDMLQVKAAIAGGLRAMEAEGRRVPVMASLTIETMGTMLVGTDIAAAWATLEPLPVDVVGLNCATGPDAMAEHLRTLSATCDRYLSCMPNAGLPIMEEGRARYPLTPQELARHQRQFVEELGVSVVGGCCGTTPEHMRAVVEAVRGVAPAAREPRHEPSVASIYSAVPLAQDTSFLIVGERTNANGSKRFRELLEQGNVDGMVGMGRDQVKEGAHVLDVCTAYVGRDEVAEMSAVVERFVRDVPAPLCIDTTEPPVVQAALERIGGRAIVNSVNLEDGGERLREILPLVREHGAALICLCIDEEGMARTADRKVEVARKILDIVVGEYGLRPQDLLFDALTFTLGSGDEEFRNAGAETLEGVRRIKEEIAGAHTLLGVSNISFGLKPAARVVLNSVFLHEAMRSGLDAAIVHAGKILPLNRFSDEERELARRIVHDRRRPGSDPLTEFMALFEEEGAGRFAARGAERSETIEEELRRRIVEGERTGLEEALERALVSRDALSIINDVLLEGMRDVGDLFATGEMQLPFVLQSAETMKAAVSHLEPHMEREEDREKGTIVLATVRGDVHDIGKNLVDIILSNNGYKTVNLGIKVPISDVIDAAREHRADAIGLSGLLVKSTVIMREDLEELNRQGMTWPVLLGGAALTRRYVEGELRGVYDGEVHYARDAFEGLSLMDRIREEGQFAGADREPRRKASPARPAERAAPVVTVAGRSAVATDVPVPDPPFLGARVVRDIPLDEIWPYLNETALFRGQWQFRGGKLKRDEHEALLEEKARPILEEWKERCAKEGLLRPAVAYGYWRCRSEGNDLVVLDGETEAARLTFPRQPARDRLCLADFFRRAESGELDTVAFTLVTVGSEASRAAKELFEADRYRDYLYLHGLGVETAEALAERWHQRVREELGIAGEDAAREAEIVAGKADPAAVRDLLRQRYRGSRYSFGYPACPDLEQQEQLRSLLPFDEIGVTLTESWQLDPEQSTTAIVCHHPEARYFRVD